ncbi:MAG: hypothetical protein AB1716_09220 [Planctomycetota bacterium]
MCAVRIVGSTLVLSGACCCLARATTAADGPPLEQVLAQVWAGPPLATGAPEAEPVAWAIVQRAQQTPGENGWPLLPPGTTLDAVRWDGARLALDLTLPVRPQPGAWHLSPQDTEAFSASFGLPFIADHTFRGVNIRVRFGPDQPYGSLAACQTPVPSPQPAARPAELPLARAPGEMTDGFTQAARQPIGALTGVTVYVSAGHGWTAGESAWALQRPVLLEMAEDYGNIDQLNYFVAYAFNAGATVVPFRPSGWQPIEIVLDQDDPGVTYTGAWSPGSSSKYFENGVTPSGVPYVWATAGPSETATARYTPVITTTGCYPVYCFTIASTNRVRQAYRVRHSGGLSELAIDHREVGNGWIWLGDYYLEAGGENWVEITNAAPDAGVVVADAVRWGGGMGDVVRPGPGRTSGYSRDEEGQRYWAHSQLGNNAVGFDEGIWDVPGSDDVSDNVGTAARWAREMNQVPPGGVQVDRWKRVHLEFHTNASNGTARGAMCLITTLGETTYQGQYARTLAREVDDEMVILQSEFEHPWVNRFGQTYTSAYGAIATTNNDNEFDATIVELAFHDNLEDAELLRDDRVRAAMARACVHGIIRFLTTLPGSQVPWAFAPDTPRAVALQDAGDGNVVLSWEPPLSDQARGDPATGYVVYQSTNGYGFGAPLVLGNVLTTTVTGVPVGETRYFRIAATNAGGESMPSEVLAVRRPAQGTAGVLLVNGFDRLRRQLNPVQRFTQPPAYAGKSIERQQWRRSNAQDYVIQHAEALAAHDYGYASCGHSAVANERVPLAGFPVVVWMLGTESKEDYTFSATEQTLVTAYLQGGGAIFVSGEDVAFDLINETHGVTFCQDTLKVGYAANSANTAQATGAAGGLLAGIGPFDFSVAAGAVYESRSPDVLTARQGARVCLDYVGGTGGAAGVQYTSRVYNAVTFGFPFECIGTPAMRAAVMGRVIDWLLTAAPLPFDRDLDGDVDWQDYLGFAFCFRGPGVPYAPGHVCLVEDGDGDNDVDLLDFAELQDVFTGPL